MVTVKLQWDIKKLPRFLQCFIKLSYFATRLKKANVL
jgi:hypothetical protein